MEVVRTVIAERQRKLGSRVIEYRFHSNDLEENLVLQSEFATTTHGHTRMCSSIHFTLWASQLSQSHFIWVTNVTIDMRWHEALGVWRP